MIKFNYYFGFKLDYFKKMKKIKLNQNFKYRNS